jgi:excisionase family DNA binding protein
VSTTPATQPGGPRARRRHRPPAPGAGSDGRGGLMTVDEAAAALNTNPRFVRRLIAERRIVFHRIGRHIRIAAQDLEAFIAAGRVEPDAVIWSAGRARVK